MPDWKVRITTKYLKIEKQEIIKVLKDISNKYIVVNEFWNDNNNPLDHIQMYVETDISERKFRKFIKEMITEGGNKAFSMDNRHSDWTGYIGYLLKYEDTEILGSSYTPEEINHYRTYYKKVSVASRSRSKNIGLLENDLEQILETIDFEKKYTIMEIANIVVNYYKVKKRVVHKANMTQLIWSIDLRLDKSDDPDFTLHLVLSDDGLRDKHNRQTDKFNARIDPIDGKTW